MRTIFLSQGKWPNKSSGARGVTWRSKNKKWVARCGIAGKRVFLGQFNTVEEAEKAVLAVREKPVPTGETIVSDVDYEYLNQFNWHLSRPGQGKRCAIRNVLIAGQWTTRKMHQDVAERMGLSLAGRTVDHKNLDPLDNRRENLRAATQAEQNCNKGLTSLNTSGVKGVCWDKEKGKWYARISLRGRVVWASRFDSLDDAKQEREHRLATLHGEFARCS